MKIHFWMSAVALSVLMSCASTQTRFDKITPNMSMDDVKKTMDAGPSRFDGVADAAYSSWYWGNDYCVLFKEGRVAAKDSSQTGNSASVGPGSYQEKHMPQCLAPGQASKGLTERSISIPGLGKVTLPGSNLKSKSSSGNTTTDGE